MENQTRIMAQVTPELLAVLIDTEKFMAQYNDPGARLKDAEHYGAAAVQLEALVTAIMIAQTRVALLGRSAIGARFHVGSGTGVMRSVDSATIYLSTTAGELLRKGNLSRYAKSHTTEVLNLMSELMDRLGEDVQIIANRDLRRIREKSVELLMATADVVAKIEGGDAASLADYAKDAGNLAQDDRVMIRNAIKSTEPTFDLRCDLVVANLGRCVRVKGHMSGPEPRNCTGEFDETRCRVDTGGGNRCLKRAGHLKADPTDDHAPRGDNRCTSTAATGRCILPAGHRTDTGEPRHIGPAT